MEATLPRGKHMEENGLTSGKEVMSEFWFEGCYATTAVTCVNSLSENVQKR